MSTSIYSLLEIFEKNKILYELYSSEDNSIYVQVAVPNKRWRFVFPQSGSMYLKIYKSTEEIQDNSKLTELGERFKFSTDNSYSLTDGLRKKNIDFFMAQYREGEVALMVSIMLPDEHWEVEFFESEEAGDGDMVQVEVFKSSSEIFGEEKIPELVKIFAD
jgi:hypothetical protein